jgi:flagellin
MGSFSINTNIASLQSQNYLRQTEIFQNETINQVTSGLRIINSGDDAAGLAIANADRSNEAVLTQGLQNANDGLSQLQIADGGISNISQLLDSARTLATESASGTFTGDRGVLNSSFQAIIQEVNRQAQAIGLNQGGAFATNLNVFVGGGTASGSITASQNGTVSVNLSQATVDAKSLGLQGVQASGTATTDIGVGSSTSVQAILNNVSNQASISNDTTNFNITGPGFTNADGTSNVVQIAVNLTGVTDANTLATAVNQAITNAGNGASQQATAFKNANITAAVNTSATGTQQLTFTSASTAFQVQGDDQVANAVLGNFQTIAGSVLVATGATADSATASNAYVTPTAAESVKIRILGDGLNGTASNDLTIALPTTATTATAAVALINTQIAATAAVAATGIKAVVTGASSDHITFEGPGGSSFQVLTAGDTNNVLGYGTQATSAGIGSTAGTFNYNTVTAAATTLAAGSQDVSVSINGGAAIDLGAIASSATVATSLTNLNAAFQGNATLRAAGLVASSADGTHVTIATTAGSSADFRIQFAASATNAFGFGTPGNGATAVTVANGTSAYAAKDTINSSGAQSSVNGGTNADVYAFTGLVDPGDAQTVTVSAVDATGAEHSLNVNLTTANAGNLDQAVGTINAAILASNDSTLKNIAAFKEQGTTASTPVNGAEGIRFLSAGSTFKVTLGASALSANGSTDVGLADGGTGLSGGPVLTSTVQGTAATADISNISTAVAAVNQLANSVAILGDAQAAVGQGENAMNYAVNLANSQLTNIASAESGIRDANLATASANLTKAQIQLQAGIAALAQANTAPQQILALLQK